MHHSNNGSFSLREGRWKILFTAGSGGWSFPTFPKDKAYIAALPSMQLYDLENDPGETRNVIGEHPDVVRRLTARMKEHIERRTFDSPALSRPMKRTAEWKRPHCL